MAKNKQSITCTVELTEGATERITDAFVDLYYKIKQGIYQGPVMPEQKDETA